MASFIPSYWILLVLTLFGGMAYLFLRYPPRFRSLGQPHLIKEIFRRHSSQTDSGQLSRIPIPPGKILGEVQQH